jgi:hypothetical protein
MTKTILIICSCGTSIERKRETLQKNIGGVIVCKCGNKYESQDILNSERFGIADYMEVKA